MENNNTEWFGIVRWCDEDLKNALEVQGITATESNIEKLHNMCSHHSFTDMMIERGWEIMYDMIAQNDWEE